MPGKWRIIHMAISKKKAAEAAETVVTAVTETAEMVTEAAEKAVKATKAKKAAAPKAEKKTAAKAEKTAEPKAEKKTTTRKKAPAVKLFVEYQGKQVAQEELVAAVQANWTGEAIKTLEMYVKPEDGAVYYVVNGTEGGKLEF